MLFLALFIVQIILFYLLYSHPVADRIVFQPLANLYANISGALLALLGHPNIVIGDIISSSSSFSVGLKKGCDAAEPMAIFIAGIVAFKANIKEKLKGLAGGLGILFILNIIRVITLYIAGIKHPLVFETMHLGVWQVVFILTAIALWLIWLQRLPADTHIAKPA